MPGRRRFQLGGRRYFQDIMKLEARPDELDWQPFRDGVGLLQIYGTMRVQGPLGFLLRFEPGAKVPRHAHTDHEHIIVLDGG